MTVRRKRPRPAAERYMLRVKTAATRLVPEQEHETDHAELPDVLEALRRTANIWGDGLLRADVYDRHAEIFVLNYSKDGRHW